MSFRTSSYCAYPSDCIEIGIIDAPRKSSFSHTTGAVHCVEIATSTARKSTFSPNGEPSCVEVVEGSERKSSFSATGRPSASRPLTASMTAARWWWSATPSRMTAATSSRSAPTPGASSPRGCGPGRTPERARAQTR